MKAEGEKLDLKRTWRDVYSPTSKGIVEIVVPKFRYLMIDGEGDPDRSSQFGEGLETLYPLAYTLKFISKRELGRDFVVMPLQGLWWADDMDAFLKKRRDEWRWRLMVLQPEWIDEALMQKAVAKVEAKGRPKFLEKARLEDYEEGLSAQVLHLGPFSDEGPVVARLHSHIEQLNKRRRLQHHGRVRRQRVVKRGEGSVDR